jgi:hypothetical protein
MRKGVVLVLVLVLVVVFEVFEVVVVSVANRLGVPLLLPAEDRPSCTGTTEKRGAKKGNEPGMVSKIEDASAYACN